MGRGQPEETGALCEPEVPLVGTFVGGETGRALGLKKNLQLVFSIPVSLSSSAVLWAAPLNSSPPAPAVQRLSRRFPGPGELQRAAGKQIGSKKGQELGQAQRQVGKEEKNKEKSKLCPKASSCRSVLFFFPP